MNNVFNLGLPDVSFNSDIVQLIMKLEVLRNNRISLTIHPHLFIQIKSIFDMIESLQSARIEGNRTTISDYVISTYNKAEKTDDIKEIQNIEKAIMYVNNCFENDKNFKISNFFLKEIHSIITEGLIAEGSHESGRYRTCNVSIRNSKHTPPPSIMVNEYMEKLIEWINKEDKLQEQLLKIAIAHHCFTWIHPFDNGNGRVSRILTYSMLRQYGFDMAYLLNSTAVFCIDRNKYFDMLQVADINTNEAKLQWCEYVLNGINEEMTKISNLMNKDFFINKIVMPAINRALELHFINKDYKAVLELALKKQDGLIKSKDIQILFKDKTTRQVTTLLSKLVEQKFLLKWTENSRQYYINLRSIDLLHGIVDSLVAENFIIVKD